MANGKIDLEFDVREAENTMSASPSISPGGPLGFGWTIVSP